MLRLLRLVIGFLASLVPVAATAQLQVAEVMYDPASGEPAWEWIEVYNPGAAPVDLDGYFVDRVGDSALGSASVPQIRSSVDHDGSSVANSTVVPAGGLAILYNGAALDYDPQRFRDAWPQVPAGVALIGVAGWSSNSLANNPAPPAVNPSLAGSTFGFWASEAAYRLDVTNLGTVETPNERVTDVTASAFTFSYDDTAPWPNNTGAASLAYDGSGSFSSGTNWAISQVGAGGAYQSTATFLESEPINGDDFGSPGQIPGGTSSAPSLLLTEVMFNPASITGSKEWEWIEVYNNGSAIDFSVSSFWLDDDDGSALTEANVTSGEIAAGETAVLFNASATGLIEMQAAWAAGGLTNFIPVDNWSTLNNGGDVVGLWSDSVSYGTDFAVGSSVANAVTGTVYTSASPWPADNGTDSMYLTNLGSDPLLPGSWSRSRGVADDPNAYQAADVFSPGGTPDNTGLDIGSPGLFAGVTQPTLAGDYNADGVVDAADYTVWRDGLPLANETVTPGVNDASDYQVWQNAFGNTTSEAVSTAASIPEPTTLLLAFLAFLALAGRFTVGNESLRRL